ncbi:MGMT family [Aspergillus sclerotialis]|uniref:MGMT family n=1 Tax=Aspergillus sclerotialis TaxID=2070753 RepID=A0A3A2Z3X0_9EURO|nr:MGMT family [Aspergillus sclerotialis]
MPRTEEAEHWFNAVYAAVQQIPYGKVTSYSHIACLLDHPKRARQVGICLKHLPSLPRSSQPARESPGSRNGNSIEQENNDQPQEEGEESTRQQPIPHFHTANVPWQRVINSRGMISKRNPGGAESQAIALRAEGVNVTTDAMGEMHVDFGVYGWFPLDLPEDI